MGLLAVEDDHLLNNTLCYNPSAADYNVDAAMTKAAVAFFSVTSITIGGALSIIIGIIGIAKFVNFVLTSIITRKKEFAMLQSIDMTGKQLSVCSSLRICITRWGLSSRLLSWGCFFCDDRSRNF